MDWSQCQAIEQDTSKLSGAWVFRGTRVPVQALFENIDAGATVDDYLAWFPGVRIEQVDEVLMFASSSLVSTWLSIVSAFVLPATRWPQLKSHAQEIHIAISSITPSAYIE